MKWVTPSQDGPRNHNAKFRFPVPKVSSNPSGDWNPGANDSALLRVIPHLSEGGVANDSAAEMNPR